MFVFLDINECALHPNICGTAVCKNTLGKYECECAEGYKYNSTSKSCEGRTSLPPSFPFIFPPLLSIFESTATQTPASLIWYIDYYGMTHLFVLLGVQAVLQGLYSFNHLLWGHRGSQYILVCPAVMPDDFVSSWDITCPTVKRTFCPSSQTN